MEETDEKITEISNQKGIARNSRFSFMGANWLKNLEKLNLFDNDFMKMLLER